MEKSASGAAAQDNKRPSMKKKFQKRGMTMVTGPQFGNRTSLFKMDEQTTLKESDDSNSRNSENFFNPKNSGLFGNLSFAGGRPSMPQ